MRDIDIHLQIILFSYTTNTMSGYTRDYQRQPSGPLYDGDVPTRSFRLSSTSSGLVVAGLVVAVAAILALAVALGVVTTQRDQANGVAARTAVVPCTTSNAGFVGRNFRGYGPDLLPLIGSKCPMFDDSGCERGYQMTTAVFSPGPKFFHQFVLFDGSYLEMKNIPGITGFFPLNQSTVNSFPTLSRYLDVADHYVVVFVSESRKDDLPYTTDWIANGTFTLDNRVEYRCQYFGVVTVPNALPTLDNFDGKICLGCHWFVGKAPADQNSYRVTYPGSPV